MVLHSCLSSPVLSSPTAVAVFQNLIMCYLHCKGLSQRHPPPGASVGSFTNNYLITLVPHLKPFHNCGILEKV